MTNQSTQRSHPTWTKTIVVAHGRRRVQPPISIKRPAPAAKPVAEKEAEQWVAQMMFERYNS